MEDILLINNELTQRVLELEKKVEFFQLIADNTFDWEIYRDVNGKIQYCNQAFEKFTGYTVKELVDGNITEKELIHPDDLNSVIKQMQTCIKAIEPVADLEFRIVAKNGEIKTVNLCSQPVFKNGEHIGFRTSIRDITNFKLYQYFIASEKHFKTLYNNITDAVFYINISDGTFISVNETAKKIYGYTDEEFAGMSITQIDVHDNDAAIKDRIQLILQKGEIQFETLHKSKENKIFPVEVKTKIIDDKTLISVVRDITGRKQKEKIIIERNKEIELLLMGSSLVLEGKDFLSTAKQILNFCREITGAKAGYIALLNENGKENDVIYLEAGGLPCFVNPKLPMPIRGLRSIVYESGKTTFDNNYLASAHAKYMPPGHIPLKNVMFAPLKQDGKVIGLLGLGEKNGDFTLDDAKLATSFAELISVALLNSKHLDTLKKREEQLQKLNRDKDRFMQILSHDLRNPFNSILGYSELLLEKYNNYDEAKIKKQLGRIYQVSLVTFNLLEDLLKWSKAQEGIIPFKPQTLRFHEICNKIIASLNHSADEKQIEIKLINTDLVKIEADVNMLSTILRNLISNSIKFTSKNGCITINAEAQQDFALISVSDNGVGIEKDKITKLWEISEQYTSAGTNGESGSGLGLLLCKEFVEKHNGKIWVESELGKGSIFKFTIPLSPE